MPPARSGPLAALVTNGTARRWIRRMLRTVGSRPCWAARRQENGVRAMTSLFPLADVDATLEPLDEAFGRQIARGEIVAGWLVAVLLLVCLAVF